MQIGAWPRLSPTKNLDQASLGRAQVFCFHASMDHAQIVENVGRAWDSLRSVETQTGKYVVRAEDLLRARKLPYAQWPMKRVDFEKYA